MKYLFNTKRVLAIVLTLFLLSACGGKDNEGNELPSVESISVKTVNVIQSESSLFVSATGLIATENEARYGFKIGGVIDKIYVGEGQTFSKGQLLASLKLTEIDAGVTQARLALEKSQRDYQRVSNLYKDSVATLEQFQNAKTALDIGQKQLDAANFNKQYAFIYANQSGFVTKKMANEGEVIESGKPVLAINETGGANAWVLKAGLSDKEWASISIGNIATLQIDAFPSEVLKAIVSKKLLTADQGSGSFQVELTLETRTKALAVGMYAKATIDTGKKSSSFSIPYDALIEADGYSAFVFVPFNKTQVKKLPVIIESFDNKSVRISSGLENVDEIIASNSAFLNEKSTITIQN